MSAVVHFTAGRTTLDAEIAWALEPDNPLLISLADFVQVEHGLLEPFENEAILGDDPARLRDATSAYLDAHEERRVAAGDAAAVLPKWTAHHAKLFRHRAWAYWKLKLERRCAAECTAGLQVLRLVSFPDFAGACGGDPDLLSESADAVRALDIGSVLDDGHRRLFQDLYWTRANTLSALHEYEDAASDYEMARAWVPHPYLDSLLAEVRGKQARQ